jgi:hypothetical protein
MIKKIEDRNYIIFNLSEIDLIDFNQVMESSPETIRKSLDNTKSFVKWEGVKMPSSLNGLQTKEGPYSHGEMVKIMTSREWTTPE